jgi:hypothetical protein
VKRTNLRGADLCKVASLPGNWGEEWPTSRLFETLISEQVHHGAEISLLRDLYRNRATLGSQTGENG